MNSPPFYFCAVVFNLYFWGQRFKKCLSFRPFIFVLRCMASDCPFGVLILFLVPIFSIKTYWGKFKHRYNTSVHVFVVNHSCGLFEWAQMYTCFYGLLIYYTIIVFCWGQYEFLWTLKTIFTEAFRPRWILISKVHKTTLIDRYKRL